MRQPNFFELFAPASLYECGEHGKGVIVPPGSAVKLGMELDRQQEGMPLLVDDLDVSVLADSVCGQNRGEGFDGLMMEGIDGDGALTAQAVEQSPLLYLHAVGTLLTGNRLSMTVQVLM